MPRVDTAGLRAALNSDPEFVIAARFWNATVRLGLGESTYILKVRDGELQSMDPPGAPNLMTELRDYDLEIYAPEQEWAQFFVDVPRPFYQDLFSAVTRHDFRYGGDIKMFFAYYAALRRMLKVMSSYATILEEAK